MMNTKNYTSTTMIDFDAIVEAYAANEAYAHEFHGIFSAVSSYIYWTKIKQAQNMGADSKNSVWLQANLDNFCEKPEYVEARIQCALLKALRWSINLNTLIHRKGGKRFLTQVIKKDPESGLYNLSDAVCLVKNIEQEYLHRTKKEIASTRWAMD